MSYNYQNYLKTDVTIQTMSTGSVDDRGLYNSDWATGTTTVGRLVSTTSDEEGGTTDLLVDEFQLYIPATVTVASNNRVAIGSDYYDIEGIENRENRFGDVVIKVLRLRKAN